VDLAIFGGPAAAFAPSPRPVRHRSTVDDEDGMAERSELVDDL